MFKAFIATSNHFSVVRFIRTPFFGASWIIRNMRQSLSLAEKC